MVNPNTLFGRMGNQMFQGAYLYAQMRDGKIPDIYVQNYEYFDKYRNEIRKWFGDGISPTPLDYVAIHVRRGKNPTTPSEPAYSENPFYVNLFETDYYQKAMAEFSNEKFMVFSDDLDFCSGEEIFKDCEFATGSELEDFNRMASAKGIIMANSSFSWWASYLSNAKVIAPKAWYADGITRTYLLPEWQLL